VWRGGFKNSEDGGSSKKLDRTPFERTRVLYPGRT
jgi:hypothetical protein